MAPMIDCDLKDQSHHNHNHTNLHKTNLNEINLSSYDWLWVVVNYNHNHQVCSTKWPFTHKNLPTWNGNQHIITQSIVFSVIVITFLMSQTLLMNKLTCIVMDNCILNEIQANYWKKIGIFCILTILEWNVIIMDDWNLDENSHIKWQQLQHCKSIMPKFVIPYSLYEPKKKNNKMQSNESMRPSHPKHCSYAFMYVYMLVQSHL